MPLDDIPIFQVLRSRMSYLTERQRLISENVANADTPGYTPRDLRPFSLPGRGISPIRAGGGGAAGSGGGGGAGGVEIARTSSRHIGASAASGRSQWRSEVRPDSETTLNGNGVVLEEQMMHMAESRVQYDAAIGFYQKSLNLIRLAARRPGQ